LPSSSFIMAPIIPCLYESYCGWASIIYSGRVSQVSNLSPYVAALHSWKWSMTSVFNQSTMKVVLIPQPSFTVTCWLVNNCRCWAIQEPGISPWWTCAWRIALLFHGRDVRTVPHDFSLPGVEQSGRGFCHMFVRCTPVLTFLCPPLPPDLLVC
jgi:hypothetical protein